MNNDFDFPVCVYQSACFSVGSTARVDKGFTDRCGSEARLFSDVYTFMSIVKNDFLTVSGAQFPNIGFDTHLRQSVIFSTY